MTVRYKLTIMLVFAMAVTVVATLAFAGGESKRVAAGLRDARSQLAKIEKIEGSDAAGGEIAIARMWIEKGFKLLTGGNVRGAAVLAERLSSQLNLVRALIATGRAQGEATDAEKELAKLKKRLSLLQERYDRLLLSRKGAVMTGAFPRGEDQGD